MWVLRARAQRGARLGHSGRGLRVGLEQQLHHIDWRALGGCVVQGHSLVLREAGSAAHMFGRGMRTTKGIVEQVHTQLRPRHVCGVGGALFSELIQSWCAPYRLR